MSDASPVPYPVLRVVRGNPSPEELAALLAVVAASGRGAAEGAAARRSGWRDPSRLRRRQFHSGPGAWRASGW